MSITATGGASTEPPNDVTQGHAQGPLYKLAIGAVGIVFGDIGTSPIYAFRETFAGRHQLIPDALHIYGVLSLIFWSMMVIVTLKYVTIVMRADNKGEGGSLALLALINRTLGQSRRWTTGIILLGVFATALFYGDSMITPAISVLSAVEGLTTVNAQLQPFVIPIAIGILVGLFAIQARGTAKVGLLFGPVMILYFIAIAVLGVRHVVEQPSVVLAMVNPLNALYFFTTDFMRAFIALGSVVLAVTGAEALYADMGHFGRRAISRAWLILVFPACVLSYMGQGALVLDDPANISSPFFLLAPGWGRLPMVILATAATVIASQAVITGAYSVASQAAQLGYLPRLRIAHTSESSRGQIYVPWINWLLMVSVLTLVFAFRSSIALAYAFGMAVTGTITITTLLYFYVARLKWRTPLWLLGVGAFVLLGVDLLFVAANLTKLAHGAWIPLLIGLTAFAVMTTWQRGREIVTAERERREGPLAEFVERLRTNKALTYQVPGTAVFLNRRKQTAPLALRANLEHNHIRHQHVVILSVETEPVPRIPDHQRVIIDDLGYADDGITHAATRFGYMETPDIPAVLKTLDPAMTEGQLQLAEASYFLSTIELRRGKEPTMAPWRKRLFIATSYITADAAEHFGLPRDRTVIMGSHINV